MNLLSPDFSWLRFDSPVPGEAVEAARDFARKAHDGQTYGGASYLEGHLDPVAGLLEHYGYNHFFQVGAYLHDTLEDCGVTRDELAQKFGPDVAEMVWCVSGFGKNRRERNDDIAAKLRARPRYVPLKLVDRTVNVEASIAEGRLEFLPMYRNEMPLYLELFNTANPRLTARLVQALR